MTQICIPHIFQFTSVGPIPLLTEVGSIIIVREYLITALKRLPGKLFYCENSLNPILSGRPHSLTTY